MHSPRKNPFPLLSLSLSQQWMGTLCSSVLHTWFIVTLGDCESRLYCLAHEFVSNHHLLHWGSYSKRTLMPNLQPASRCKLIMFVKYNGRQLRGMCLFCKVMWLSWLGLENKRTLWVQIKFQVCDTHAVQCSAWQLCHFHSYFRGHHKCPCILSTPN